MKGLELFPRNFHILKKQERGSIFPYILLAYLALSCFCLFFILWMTPHILQDKAGLN